MPRIDAFLKVMQQSGASDLHIGDGYSPILRMHGSLEPTKHRVLSTEEVKILLFEMLAAMVDYLNDNTNHHIITLEDPLEFVHSNKNCLINQRQIGQHSRSFAKGLRAALREDPNVVMVGEMRDNETISLALTAAETGLLVLGTLHTKSAAQTINRIVDVFPSSQQDQVRMGLSEVLVGVCSQQLARRADGQGRVAALEIMVRTPAIANLIRESKVQQINTAIVTGKQLGMQKLENHLRELVSSKVITSEEAALHAENPQEFLVGRKDSPADRIPPPSRSS